MSPRNYPDEVLVECRNCPVRRTHCADCMVTALWQLSVPQRLDERERRAVDLLVGHGLVSVAAAADARVHDERVRRGVG